MRLETGIYQGSRPSQNDGWRILCEQEKTPFRMTDRPDCPVLVCERETPAWLADYLERGGAAVISGAVPEQLPFPTDYIGSAVLEYADLTDLGGGNARIQSLVQVFNGMGLGKLSLHEKRVTKLGMTPDEYPAVLFQRVGLGGCWYTGISCAALLSALGDTLRRTDSFSDYTERVTAVDKHLLLRAMRFLLTQAYRLLELPYISLGYYPENYRGVFAFRVDVDGIYGENLGLLNQAAADCGIRTTFYVNQNMCKEEWERLLLLDPMHDIGCHAVIHNLFTSEEDNYANVHNCRVWMDSLGLRQGPWFVAPRGMWNFALNRALEREGIAYTSDFGFCIHGLPFYPYFNSERMAVKQIPVNPFSAERAYAQAEEEGRGVPSAEFIAEYFCHAAREQHKLGLPILLYSHPQRFGPLAAEVLPRLKACLDGMDVWQTTFAEWSAWWDLRDGAAYSVEYEPGSGALTVDGTLPDKVRLCVEEQRKAVSHAKA